MSAATPSGWLFTACVARAGRCRFKQIDKDIAAETLKHADVDWADSMRLAEDLSAKYTEFTGCASVDVWHVAAARLLRADTFWTFDSEQQALAKRTGYFKHAPRLD